MLLPSVLRLFVCMCVKYFISSRAHKAQACTNFEQAGSLYTPESPFALVIRETHDIHHILLVFSSTLNTQRLPTGK